MSETMQALERVAEFIAHCESGEGVLMLPTDGARELAADLRAVLGSEQNSAEEAEAVVAAVLDDEDMEGETTLDVARHVVAALRGQRPAS